MLFPPDVKTDIDERINNRQRVIASIHRKECRHPAGEPLTLAAGVILPHGAVDFLRDDVDICIFDRLVTRAGDWKAAIATLEKSMELRKGGDSGGLVLPGDVPLAAGQQGRGSAVVRQGRPWMEAQTPMTNETLVRFRAEAAELLGVNEKK